MPRCIGLNEEKEPEIYSAVRPGALVENTTFFPNTNKINFDNGAVTENTRVSYPLNFISNAQEPSIGGIPKNIFFLTCDAYGVLPPIARLNPGQTMYQFISGYTAKVAGTETGITEPKPHSALALARPSCPCIPVNMQLCLAKKCASTR